jgi:hypothetical protein
MSQQRFNARNGFQAKLPQRVYQRSPSYEGPMSMSDFEGLRSFSNQMSSDERRRLAAQQIAEAKDEERRLCGRTVKTPKMRKTVQTMPDII